MAFVGTVANVSTCLSYAGSINATVLQTQHPGLPCAGEQQWLGVHLLGAELSALEMRRLAAILACEKREREAEWEYFRDKQQKELGELYTEMSQIQCDRKLARKGHHWMSTG